MSSIFGGSKSKQTSKSVSNQQSTNSSLSQNTTLPWLQETYGGAAQSGVNATRAAEGLLGIGGDPAASRAALDDYSKSAGLDFVLDRGTDAITQSRAARGLGNSGATLKRLSDYGQETGKSFFNQYFDRLLGMSGNGLSIGNLIAGAGQRSESTGQSTGSSVSDSLGTSKSKPGIAGFLGQALTAASDRRLKTDIEQVGTNEGLGVYKFRYEWDLPGTVRLGYMADEVAELFPEAIGPELAGGYKTVNYGKAPALGDE